MRLTVALAFLTVIGPMAGFAGSIDLTDPAPTYSASAMNCTGVGGPWASCGANGYLTYGDDISSTSSFTNLSSFNTTSPLGEETFASSFAAWTGTAAGAGWTLDDGGQLDVDYDITEFQTNASTTGGGVTINVDVSTTDPNIDLSDYVWTQALLVNYLVTAPAGTNEDPPVSAMDTFSFNLGGAAIPAGSTCSNTGAGGQPYCDPAYPFQYADTHFSDGPSGVYPMDSFRGIALLSDVDYATKTLTVYDTGVDYGFDLYVSPEPGTWMLISAGLGLVVVLRRRAAAGV